MDFTLCVRLWWGEFGTGRVFKAFLEFVEKKSGRVDKEPRVWGRGGSCELGRGKLCLRGRKLWKSGGAQGGGTGPGWPRGPGEGRGIRGFTGGGFWEKNRAERWTRDPEVWDDWGVQIGTLRIGWLREGFMQHDPFNRPIGFCCGAELWRASFNSGVIWRPFGRFGAGLILTIWSKALRVGVGANGAIQPFREFFGRPEFYWGRR